MPPAASAEEVAGAIRTFGSRAPRKVWFHAGMDPRDAPLDGVVFAGVSNSADGDVGTATRFTYHQDGAVVWAEYGGGDVVRGYLVGTRDGAQLQFRYVHVDAAGATASGRCSSEIVIGAAGGVELHEDWAWESRPGTGRSVVAQI